MLKSRLYLFIAILFCCVVPMIAGLEEVSRFSETLSQENTNTLCSAGGCDVEFTREVKEYSVEKMVNGNYQIQNYSVVEIKVKNNDASKLKNFKLTDMLSKSLLNSTVTFEEEPVLSSSDEGLSSVWVIPEINPGEEKIIKYSIDRSLTKEEIASFKSPSINTEESDNFLPTKYSILFLILFILLVIGEGVFLKKLL